MKKTIQKRLVLLSGSHNQELAKKVAKALGIKLSSVHLDKFADGEIKCRLDESVRGADVFVFQSHSPSVNDAIMEQAVMIDAAKRASAGHITAVCPFFGYARQDRKATGREPISAKLVVDILSVAGAQRIVGVDLHSGQIQGFFNGPFDHLVALPALAAHIKRRFKNDLVIVSPDAGRVKIADRYARRLGAALAIVHKRRSRSGRAEALHVIGDVKNRNCIIVDDMIDTAGTVCAAADQLKNHGAKSVSVVATHGLFSPPAADRLARSSIEMIIVTDTLPQVLDTSTPKIETVSVSRLLSLAIKAIFQDKSVSAIFKGQNQN